ncbi:MAG: PilZ domain-containing protein, partial [Chloroflexi bacterium]|nr:PilZ domain-containing protein [Chloroflexota bacterium]
SMPEHDRRQFPRVKAPVFCSPVGLALFQDRAAARDISMGGMRVYSDNPYKPGARLELEVFLPGDTSVICKVEVAWCAALVDDVAAYDVGVRFIGISETDRLHLASVLDESESSSSGTAD